MTNEHEASATDAVQDASPTAEYSGKRPVLAGEKTIPGRYATVEPSSKPLVPEHWAVFKIFRRGAVTTYSLDADKVTSFVGTDPDQCDVVFKDTSLSDKELAVTRIGSDYVLTDCGRKDLVTFNGIASRQVVCPSGERCVINMGNSTMIFDTVQHHPSILRKFMLRYRLTGEPIMRKPEKGSVSLVMGPRSIDIGLQPVLIGSCALCDLALSDKMLQPFHAMFHWTPDGLAVTRLSQGHVSVNGMQIEKFRQLSLTDRVQLGGATFTLKVQGTISELATEMFGDDRPQFQNFRFSPMPCSVSDAFTISAVGGDVMIGRDETADVVLDDEGISRAHAQLIPMGKTCMIIDNYSSNGTHVNHMPVSKSRLRAGDLLEMGRSVFLFHFD